LTLLVPIVAEKEIGDDHLWGVVPQSLFNPSDPTIRALSHRFVSLR
jgi:hypothetical protein